MNPKVRSVEPLAEYKLKLLFANGEVRIFDVTPYLNKGIFTQLQDEAYFRKVRAASGAVQWPNAQDFSHDTLFLLGKVE
jgi:hypothetical protein